jgi:hypothetical protein
MFPIYRLAVLVLPFIAGCAAAPMTPDQIRQISSDELCVARAILGLSGSVTYNGHPIPQDVLFNEGRSRGISCEPHSYYISVAQYRLQRQQAAEQNTLLAEQAIVAGMQQTQAQFQARQALNAQTEAAYYQQQQANLAAQAQAQRQAQQQQAANLQQGQAQYYQQQQLLDAIKAPSTTTCMDIGSTISCNTTH